MFSNAAAWNYSVFLKSKSKMAAAKIESFLGGILKAKCINDCSSNMQFNELHGCVIYASDSSMY